VAKPAPVVTVTAKPVIKAPAPLNMPPPARPPVNTAAPPPSASAPVDMPPPGIAPAPAIQAAPVALDSAAAAIPATASATTSTLFGIPTEYLLLGVAAVAAYFLFRGSGEPAPAPRGARKRRA
jgi:hypothetical protein